MKKLIYGPFYQNYPVDGGIGSLHDREAFHIKYSWVSVVEIFKVVKLWQNAYKIKTFRNTIVLLFVI